MKTDNQSQFLFTAARPILRARVCEPPRSSCAAGFRLLTLLVLASALCQCTHVPLMKRGRLADYTMSPDRDPLAVSLRDHVFFSREAASGGRAIGGGGCGCN